MFRTTRRQFLSTSAASVLAFQQAAPSFLHAAAHDQSADGRILVVIELAGGNDGLNTVIPHRHDVYQKSRPELGFRSSDVLELNSELGLHPTMTGFKSLFDDGQLAIVQGVGYPNPNRSHFESMDIWHTCRRRTEQRPDGWLGRALEQQPVLANDPIALHLGENKQPFALMSRQVRVTSIRSLEDFRLKVKQSDRFRKQIQQLSTTPSTEENDLLQFVQSSTQAALSASQRIESTQGMSMSGQNFPDHQLAQQLKTVSQLIKSGLQTPVYYLQLAGFDSHAQQAGLHEALLRTLSDSVTAFVEDLKEHGLDDRVLCVCFSEFGRRVSENASKGTDHGTAGPMFVVGKNLNAGLIGQHPDLNNLKDGDLRHHTDFRRVYSAVLQDWLNCNAQPILGAYFSPIKLFAKT